MNVKKKSRKFVPLFTEGANKDQMSAILPGRVPCQCLAIRHKLVNNCTGCGRIVCEQEGSGPCFFCHKLVANQDDTVKLLSGLKSSKHLYKNLMEQAWSSDYQNFSNKGNNIKITKDPQLVDDYSSLSESDNTDEELITSPEHNVSSYFEKSLTKALLQRDRLLDFDLTSAQRTRVIDDELDYFVNEGSGLDAAWLDPEMRKRVSKRIQELQTQRHASKMENLRICIDFTGKRAREEYVEDVTNNELYSSKNDVLIQENLSKLNTNAVVGDITDPMIITQAPRFLSATFKPTSSASQADAKVASLKVSNREDHFPRVQDSEQQSTIDKGLCLSMHQPWASLLVRGLKRHEGRSWYTPHRGCLWIASTAQHPKEMDVKEIEGEYLNENVKVSDMPTSYPTGCLLGCVNIEDVLPREEYRRKYPNSENINDYMFICSSPRELLIKLPIKGKYKIYKLEKTIHIAATQNLV